MRKVFSKLRVRPKFISRIRLPRNRHEFRLVSRHPFAVPFITIGVLIVLTGSIWFVASRTHKLPAPHDAKIVIISHDHDQQTVPTTEATVGDLLEKLNIKINDGDVVEPAQSTRINQDQFRINVYRAVPVEIVDGANHTYTFSASKTPRAIAQQVGVSLFPEDNLVTLPSDNFLSGSIGEQVVVDRATPINVDLYGTQVVLRTHAKTVAGMMKEKNIKLIKDDKVSVPLNTPITPNQQVAFIRTGTKTETITEDIATPIQTINDPTLAYGTQAVRQQGSPGQQIVTYQVSIVNNVETGRSVIQKVVTKQAVTQIVVMGTSLSGIKGDMALAGISPSDYTYVDYIVSHESGWRPNAGSPSGPYGLCQAYPGTKMASAGADWLTNPITQLRWCSGYAAGRYGSWAAAYNHWVATRNW